MTGLLIAAVYRLTVAEVQGANDIFDQGHPGNRISLWQLPAIFCGTIGFHTRRTFRLNSGDLRTVTMTGMAVFFRLCSACPSRRHCSRRRCWMRCSAGGAA